MRRSVFLTVGSLLVLILALPVRAEDPKELEKWLEDNLKGKILTVRHFYSGSRLRYDSSGKLVKGGKPGPWTLTGKVQVSDVKVGKKGVEIRGRRIQVWYNEKEKKLENVDGSENVKIVIEVSGEQATQPDVRGALQQIFLTPADKLEDVVPKYWRRALCSQRPDSCEAGVEQAESDVSPETELLEGLPLPEPGAERAGVYRIGGDVTPPQCLSCRDPKYPEPAQNARLEGVVVIWAIVNERGRAEKFTIVKTLGLGLDDAAIDAIREWRFEPARRGGKPVPVFMTIEVNFHLK